MLRTNGGFVLLFIAVGAAAQQGKSEIPGKSAGLKDEGGAPPDPMWSASLSSSGKVKFEHPSVSSAAESLMRKVQKHMELWNHSTSLIESDADPSAVESSIGLVIEDDAACNFEDGWSLVNFGTLNGDINQGAGGKDIFLCQNPDKITFSELRLSEKKEACREGDWKLVPWVSSLNGDLNEGAGGDTKDIFLCFKEGKPKVKYLTLADSSCETGYSKVTDPDGNLNGDLNQKAGGKDIYLCSTTKERSKVEAPSGLKISASKDCASGSNLVQSNIGLNGDLNQGAGGKDIFLCMADKTENLKFTDLKLVENGEKCPMDYTLVPHDPSLNGDLNQGSGGKDIFLCYINEKSGKKITDLTLAKKSSCTHQGDSAVCAGNGFDLNGDLNQGAGGDTEDIFLCYSGGKPCPVKENESEKANANKLATLAAFLVTLFLGHFFYQ